MPEIEPHYEKLILPIATLGLLVIASFGAKRGKYEFNDQVKESARRKWHKENPGNEDAKLEVDHIVPVWFARKKGIAPDLVNTRKNARALTQKEHKQRHRQEPSEEEYEKMAGGLLGIIGRLFD